MAVVSLHFESSGIVLENQPELLGEYSLADESPEVFSQQQRSFIGNKSITRSKFRSFQVDQDRDSPIYYQRGEILPSSAQVPALAGLRWLYFQLIQPPTHPPIHPSTHPGEYFPGLE